MNTSGPYFALKCLIYITQYVDTYLFDWLGMNEANDSA